MWRVPGFCICRGKMMRMPIEVEQGVVFYAFGAWMSWKDSHATRFSSAFLFPLSSLSPCWRRHFEPSFVEFIVKPPESRPLYKSLHLLCTAAYLFMDTALWTLRIVRAIVGRVWPYNAGAITCHRSTHKASKCQQREISTKCHLTYCRWSVADVPVDLTDSPSHRSLNLTVTRRRYEHLIAQPLNSWSGTNRTNSWNFP